MTTIFSLNSLNDAGSGRAIHWGKTEMEWLEEFYNAAFTAARAKPMLQCHVLINSGQKINH